MKRTDLHIHSLFSDGTNTPTEIISEAKRLDLTVALTDHNTVSGIPEFLSAAEEQGVCAVAGTELSTDYDGTELHLLGLFIPPENLSKVEFFTKEANLLKEISNIELIERLNAAGYELDYVTVKKRNAGDGINRAHVAAELLEKGYVSSINEAFSEILAEDNGFYVPPPRTRLCDAITFLRGIGAVPVIAHPLQELSEERLRALLPEAIEAGLIGIEVYHSSYDAEKIRTAIQIADDFALAKSGGSDYHGMTKPDVALGAGKGQLDIPIEIYGELLEISKKITAEIG